MTNTISNHNATTVSAFILSGVGNNTGIYPTFGMRDITIFSEAVPTGLHNGNGSVLIQGRTHENAGWFNLSSQVNFTNSSGVATQYFSPLQAVQAIVSNRLSGAFNVSLCARG